MITSVKKCRLTLTWPEYLDYQLGREGMAGRARDAALMLMSLHAHISAVQLLGPRKSDNREDDSRKRIIVIGRPAEQKRGAA